ncbi:MAG: ATP-binding protein [Pseudomonadota bacterium]
MSPPFAEIGECLACVALEPHLEAVAPAVERALRVCPSLSPAPGDDAVQEAMRLALTEALNNVLEHSGHDPSVPVRIHHGLGSDGPWFCVEDRGVPLPSSVFEERQTDHDYVGMELDALPEGGWGWMLIRASVARLDYCRDGATNFLLLVAPTACALA